MSIVLKETSNDTDWFSINLDVEDLADNMIVHFSAKYPYLDQVKKIFGKPKPVARRETVWFSMKIERKALHELAIEILKAEGAKRVVCSYE